ncbi:MAG: hypothetical protein GXO92_04295 [FCB group bacterium]|nr:hypothetical protein [FCB group bacterium]
MNPKTLHNLTWIPLFIIGLSFSILGIMWVVARDPWLLDQAANERLLAVGFETLFKAEINARLPDYLILSYRFFGLWMFSIGLLLMTFIQVTRMGTRSARNAIHIVLAIIITGVYVIEFTFIPGSPFLFLTHLLAILFIISVYSSQKLKRFD